MTSPVVTIEGFPQGLRCMDCDLILEPGMPFSERLVSITGDGTPCVELTCVPCGLKVAQ